MMVRADDGDEVDREMVERLRLAGTVEHQTGDWFVAAVVKWAKVITAIGAAGVLLGGIAVAMGWRLVSPSASVTEVQREHAKTDSLHRELINLLAVRVGQVENARAETNMRLNNVEDNICLLLRTVAPNAVPRDCR
jgi:hypothetical protein